MTDEVDIDTFLFGRRVDVGAEKIVAPAAPPPEPARPEPRQTTLEGADEPVGPKKPSVADQIAAVVFRSRTGSDRPHIVTVMHFPATGKREVFCTCEAALNIARRPEGCWAMLYVRDLMRIPQPGGPA